MRRLVGAILLMLAVLVVPSVDVHAQKDKKKKDQPKQAGPIDSAKLSGEFFGTIRSVPGSDRMFTVETEVKKLVPSGNRGGNRGNIGRGNNNVNRILQIQNQMTQAQRQVATARTPQQRNQAAQRMTRAQIQLQQAIAQMQAQALRAGGGNTPGYKVETTKQTIEFQAADAIKVRTLVLPEVFDDKGQVKKYTNQELADLKGKDKTQPGYESSLEKLEVGQKVRVVLAPAPAKKKDADADTEDKRMQVRLLVITGEAESAPMPKRKKK